MTIFLEPRTRQGQEYHAYSSIGALRPTTRALQNVTGNYPIDNLK